MIKGLSMVWDYHYLVCLDSCPYIVGWCWFALMVLSYKSPTNTVCPSQIIYGCAGKMVMFFKKFADTQ